MDSSYGYPEPNFVQGMILQAESSKMVQGTSYYKTGERMVAWYGGKNMGSVTQWLYPSNNGRLSEGWLLLNSPLQAWRQLDKHPILSTILDVTQNWNRNSETVSNILEEWTQMMFLSNDFPDFCFSKKHDESLLVLSTMLSCFIVCLQATTRLDIELDLQSQMANFGFVSNWFTGVYPTWKKPWKNRYTQHKRRCVFFSSFVLLSFVGGYPGPLMRKSLEDWIKGAGLAIFWSLSNGDFSSKGIGGFPTETSRKLGRNSGVPP